MYMKTWFSVSATECAASALMTDEPPSRPATILASATTALTTSATSTVPLLSLAIVSPCVPTGPDSVTPSARENSGPARAAHIHPDRRPGRAERGALGQVVLERGQIVAGSGGAV